MHGQLKDVLFCCLMALVVLSVSTVFSANAEQSSDAVQQKPSAVDSAPDSLTGMTASLTGALFGETSFLGVLENPMNAKIQLLRTEVPSQKFDRKPQTSISALQSSVAIPEIPSVHRPLFSNHLAPQWQKRSLDEGQLNIEILSKPLVLQNTDGHLGTEYFQHSAYVFYQLASQLNDEHLALKLNNLGNQSMEMALMVQESGKLYFEGRPDEGFRHLHTRSSILSYLNQINVGGAQRLSYDQKGHMIQSPLAELPLGQDAKPGELLKAFAQNAETIEQELSSRQLLEAEGLVKRQVELVEQLGLNLRLQWESTYVCHQSHQCGSPIDMKIFASQSLSQDDLERIFIGI